MYPLCRSRIGVAVGEKCTVLEPFRYAHFFQEPRKSSASDERPLPCF
jgi:hypothetical protein